MQLSVIVPIIENIQENQLKSIINDIFEQELKEIELIFISTDMYNFVPSFNEKLTVRMIQTEYNNLAWLISKGIEVAQGQYAIFLDADAQINKNLLKELMDQANETTIVKNRILLEKIETIQKSTHNFSKFEALDLFVLNTPFRPSMNHIWATLYPIQLLKKINYQIQSNYGYYDIFFELFFGCTQVVFLNNDYYHLGNSTLQYFKQNELAFFVEQINALNRQIDQYKINHFPYRLLEYRLAKLLKELIDKSDFANLSNEKQAMYRGNYVGLSIKL